MRDDDKPDVIKNRLDQYHSKTEPLVEHYEQQGILQRVDGEEKPDVVTEKIRGLLATLRREDEMEM